MTKKETIKPIRFNCFLYIGIRQRLIFPARLQASIVSAEGLNFCVRNGNRWIPLAIATGMVKCFKHTQNYIIHYSNFSFSSFQLFAFLFDQALDLLVSVSFTHYCASTPDLSTS